MATLPTDPKHGATYRLEPDDETTVKFRPYHADDERPWDVSWPGGAQEWWSNDDIRAVPGELVPVETTP